MELKTNVEIIWAIFKENIQKTHKLGFKHVLDKISVLFAVTDGATIETLMFPCTKALLYGLSDGGWQSIPRAAR